MFLAGASLLATPIVVSAQSGSGRVRRIGFLGSETAAGYREQIEAFRAGLRDYGYLEERNIVVEYRWADGNRARLAEQAAELVQANVEVLVTHGPNGVEGALAATTRTPIVIASIGRDPVAAGYVASLARPGGNITGSTSLSGTLHIKQVELVKELMPGVTRLAVLRPAMNIAMPYFVEIEVAARSLSIAVVPVVVSDASEIEAAIASLAGRSDALIPANFPLFVANAKRISELSVKHRIPLIGNIGFADAGGLLGYGADTRSGFRRAGYFIDRILKGANPGDLPIEQAMNIELVVNMKTAKALGLTIPPTIVVRANRVIN